MSASAHGTHRVELWGEMPVGWLGSFTRATSRLGLDIERGVARRGEQARWSAELEVRDTSGGDITLVDFSKLAREPGHAGAVPALELFSFELARSVEERRALVLTIRAPDKVGFLASLLEHLAGLVLFPEQIRIDTFGQEAQDVLWLSSVGGQSPAPEIEAALSASLLAYMRRRPSSFPNF